MQRTTFAAHLRVDAQLYAFHILCGQRGSRHHETSIEFTLTVNDGTASVSDKTIVTVTDSANSPPVVNAGNDQQAAEGSTVSLDATVTDADAEDTLTYAWTHNSTLSISFADSSAVDTTFAAPNVSEETSIEFTLTVNDGTASVSDKTIVTVTDSANSPPVVNAGNDQQAAEGSTVSLDATVTDADAEDTLTYAWTHNSTLSISFADSAAVDTTFTAPQRNDQQAAEGSTVSLILCGQLGSRHHVCGPQRLRGDASSLP